MRNRKLQKPSEKTPTLIETPKDLISFLGSAQNQSKSLQGKNQIEICEFFLLRSNDIFFHFSDDFRVNKKNACIYFGLGVFAFLIIKLYSNYLNSKYDQPLDSIQELRNSVDYIFVIFLFFFIVSCKSIKNLKETKELEKLLNKFRNEDMEIIEKLIEVNYPFSSHFEDQLCVIKIEKVVKLFDDEVKLLTTDIKYETIDEGIDKVKSQLVSILRTHKRLKPNQRFDQARKVIESLTISYECGIKIFLKMKSVCLRLDIKILFIDSKLLSSFLIR